MNKIWLQTTSFRTKNLNSIYNRSWEIRKGQQNSSWASIEPYVRSNVRFVRGPKICLFYLEHFGILVSWWWCRPKKYCWKMTAVSDDGRHIYCGIDSCICKFGEKCSIWRYEDVWNTPSECTAWEISSVMEQLPKSPKA